MGDFPNESTISKPLKPFQAITVPTQYEDDGRKEHFERRKTPFLKRVIVVLLSIFVTTIALCFALWLMQSKIQSLTKVYDKLEAVEDDLESISDSIRVQSIRFGLQQNQTIDDTAIKTTMLDNDAFDSNPNVPEEAKDDLIERFPSSFFSIIDSIIGPFKKLGLPQNRSIEDTALNTTVLNKDASYFDQGVKGSEEAKEDPIHSSSSSSFGGYSKMIFKLNMKILYFNVL